MDADVKFTGKSIKNKELPVEYIFTHLKVDDGLMTIDPVDFAVAGGDIKASVTINAREEIPLGAAKLEVKRLQLPKLFPKLELTKDSKGLIGGAANVKGKGESVGALLASTNGRFGMIMSGGEMSETVLAAIDLDGAKLIKLLFTGDKNVPVRCGVIDFDIKDGVMNSRDRYTRRRTDKPCRRVDQDEALARAQGPQHIEPANTGPYRGNLQGAIDISG
jgi:uncharacterized protein involved in outer membrane biogenesis